MIAALADPPVPSLVLCSESVEQITVEGVGQICPKRPYVVVADDDPDLRYPASCDAYGCKVCGPRKAVEGAAVMTWAIRHADRSRLVTLTLAPENWQTRRQKVRDLGRSLRARGYQWEVAWTTEPNPKGTGVHIHGIQHGASKVPQAELQDTWGSIVDIRAIRQDKAKAVRYLTKEALRVTGYVVKNGTARHSDLEGHLDLNGGRAAHWSRGFLHGLTKREALAEIRKELGGGEARSWHLIPAWSASGQPMTSPA